ncbi:MAG: alkylation response protein AidB-like acyl-CoA dehydrogenase [Parasphingorhabdus sp.]|jgi:alkylation response protein AidB-like acyl-CoA dehydrogenase
MDFNQPDEHRILQDTLRRFFQARYSHELRRQNINSGEVYNTELFTELASLGVLGALHTEDNGGFGGKGFDIATVFEELGRAGVVEPILGSALLAGCLLAKTADPDIQEHIDLLGDVISGASLISFAHGEPDSRYDLNRVTTQAIRKGDSIVINGVKTHVINGDQASRILVSAREFGDTADESGISLFLLPADAHGVKCVGHMNIDGSAAATITLEDVKISTHDSLGERGAAYPAIEAARCYGILAVCAEAVGAMETCKELTIEYLRERQQFGQPIGKFQALQHRMVDMLIEIEQARSAMVNLAGNLNQPRAIRERNASAAKNLIGRVGALVSEECIQMHGGIGMTDEYALSHFARRLIMIDHQFGDADHHLERFISWNEV